MAARRLLDRVLPGLLLLLAAGLAPESHAQGRTLGDNVALALSSEELVAAQPAHGDSRASLRVFGLDGSLRYTLIVDDVEPGDRFGAAIALDREWLVVGAPGGPSGRAFVFRRSAGSAAPDSAMWEPAGVVHVRSRGAKLGTAVALHDGALLVGAPGINTVVVIPTVSQLSIRSRLTHPDLAEDDGFGSAVAADGAQVYVGAPRRNAGAGSVFVFSQGEDGVVLDHIQTEPGMRRLGTDILSLGTGRFITSALDYVPDIADERRSEDSILQFVGVSVFDYYVNDLGRWHKRVVADTLRDRSLLFTPSLPVVGSASELAIGLPGSGRIETYAAGDSGWVPTGEIAAYPTERGLGIALAAADGRLAARSLQGLCMSKAPWYCLIGPITI